jgi:hypothetical protein
MDTLVINAIASIILIAGFASLCLEWLFFSEYRKLKRILRNGREYEAVILGIKPQRPTMLSPENVRLRVQLLAEKPIVTEFSYEATYPEYRELGVGKIITIDIDPANRGAAIITRKQVGDFPARSAQTSEVLSA